MFHILRNYQTGFPRAAPFRIPTSGVWRFPFLRTLASTCYVCVLLPASLEGVKWYLIATLICICLIPNDAGYPMCLVAVGTTAFL